MAKLHNPMYIVNMRSLFHEDRIFFLTPEAEREASSLPNGVL